MSSLYLKHYGVLGMHWGIRRYQNYDGTLKHPKGNKSDGYKEPSKKEVNDYRTEMQNRYAGINPEKEKFYKNASEKDIREDIKRKQTMKKVMVGVGIGVGVAAIGVGVYAAYKYGAMDKIEQGINPKTAMHDAMDDVDYILKKDSTIHRMHGYEGFDLSKMDKPMYSSFTLRDRYAYKRYLKDRPGAEGRWDVSLKVMEDLQVPTRKKTEEIFNDLYKNNPEFKKDLVDQVTGLYKSLGMGTFSNEAAKAAIDDNPFMTGMYALVGKGKATDTMTKAYTQKGYKVIQDFFDIEKGMMGMVKKPVIFLDTSSLTKIGEKEVYKF